MFGWAEIKVRKSEFGRFTIDAKEPLLFCLDLTPRDFRGICTIFPSTTIIIHAIAVGIATTFGSSRRTNEAEV